MLLSQFFRRTGIFLSLLIYPLVSQAEYVVYDLDNLPGGPNPPTEPYTPSSVHSHQLGPQTMLFVYVVPVDGNESSQKSFAQLEAELDNTSRFYFDQSFRKTWFGPKVMNAGEEDQYVVPKLEVLRVDLPRTVQEYRSNFGLLRSDTISAVRALGGEYSFGELDPSIFDRIQVTGDPKLISSTGLAYVHGDFSYSGNALSGGTVRHELGHNWGVFHANRWIGNDGIPRNASGQHIEYGDGADVMGGSGSGPFNAMLKTRLHFLTKGDNEVETVTESGTYRLFAHTNPESRLPETWVRSLLVPVTGSARQHKKIFLGYRHTSATPGQQGRNSWDTHAVQVHSHYTADSGNHNSGSHFIDTTPGSRQSNDHHDGAIKIGRTYSEGPHVNGEHIYGGMHITPIDRGNVSADGSTHHYIDVVINYGEFPDNGNPVASFDQSIYVVDTGTPLSLTLNASDPDGDELAYDWDFGDDGYNLVSSETQTHTWSSSGLYLMEATVSDMKGGTDTAQAWVNVDSVPFQQPDPPAASLEGLHYRYYEGVWNSLPQFDSLIPEKSGTVSTVSISPREQNEDFGFVFEGYINVPEDDVYTFHLISNDGARLWIGDTLAIDFDGLKSSTIETEGNIALDSGAHSIRLEYFHRSGNEQLELSWSTLTNERTEVSSNNFSQTDWEENLSPEVEVTSPENGDSFTVGEDILLSADATDADGIEKVQFFHDSALIATVTEAPYDFLWENVSAGEKHIRAMATDTTGRWSLSETVDFEVTGVALTRVISVNFHTGTGSDSMLASSEVAGAVYAAPNWINIAGGNNTDVTQDNLQDHTGETTTASLRVRFTHLNGMVVTTADTSTPNGKLMRRGFWSRDGGNPREVLVEDIPYEVYDVYVYFDINESDTSDTQVGEYRIGNQSRFGKNAITAGDGVGDYPLYDTWVGFKEATATSSTAPESEILGNYVVFRDLEDPEFLLEVIQTRRAVNGIQIVDTSGSLLPPKIEVSSPSISNLYIPEEVLLIVEGNVTDNVVSEEELDQSWSVVSAPEGATVVFETPDSINTAVEFSHLGEYEIQFTASNEEESSSSTLFVTVGETSDEGTLPLEDLALWLRLSETSGTTAQDSSTSGFHGTLEGGPSWHPDGGLHFTGSDQYVHVPEATELHGAEKMTFLFRVHPDQNNNNVRGLFSKRIDQNNERSWSMFMHNNNGLSVDIGSDRITSSQAIPANEWTHVAVVFDGTLSQSQRLRIYFNGELEGTYSIPRTFVPTGSGSVTLGTLNVGENRSLIGRMADAAVYQGRALTERAISDIADGEMTYENQGPWIGYNISPEGPTGEYLDLEAMITDDGLPQVPGAVTTQWLHHSGPGTAEFTDTTETSTTVLFTEAGTHVLRLTASDGEIKTARDTLAAISQSSDENAAFEDWLQTYGYESADPDNTYVMKGGRSVTLREAYLLGEDPTDPADQVRITQIEMENEGGSEATIQFRFHSLPNRRYFLESSNNLKDWSPVSGWEEGLVDEGQEHIISLPAPNIRGFYRLRVTMP
ncbi:MAG: PKD domain-containing protein [Kiritimatiellae bacterium]|nr:PKD domain-containing protein [Kiritimatiellia bacterium]